MRSKAPLALMEQTIMVLVFALAAALCLRAFVWSDSLSDRAAARDRAVLQAQSAAETIKHTRGDYNQTALLLGGEWDGSRLRLDYDGDWQPAGGAGEYSLQIRPEDSGRPGLGMAEVTVSDGEGCLAQLTVAWQEVGGNGG